MCLKPWPSGSRRCSLMASRKCCSSSRSGAGALFASFTLMLLMARSHSFLPIHFRGLLIQFSGPFRGFSRCLCFSSRVFHRKSERRSMKHLASRLQNDRKWLETHGRWPLRERPAAEVVLLHLKRLATLDFKSREAAKQLQLMPIWPRIAGFSVSAVFGRFRA